MPAVAERKVAKRLVGSPQPRIAPPTPAKANLKPFREVAAKLDLELWPWQETAARYLLAVNADGDPLHREVCIVVARRNGKTTLLMPFTVSRLLDGQAIMHVAQTLKLPGLFFEQLVTHMETHYPELIPKKRGVSRRAGQEELRLTTGGIYRLMAANNGAARGLSNDVVMIDELRQMNDLGVLASVAPTVAHSRKRQRVYITNAGTDESVCLKSIQDRAAAGDPSLAYLEWSAAPERSADDIAGWLEANPAIGHNPAILEGLEEEYRSALLGGTLPDFETERLCRWQASLAPRLVDENAWDRVVTPSVGNPSRASMAVSLDASRTRASATVAWQDPVSRVVKARVVVDVTGEPLPVGALAADLRALALKWRVSSIGFDPWTDEELVRQERKAVSVKGQKFASSTSRFVELVESGTLAIQDETDAVARDLKWATRRATSGATFMAVQSSNDQPITALLATIRAVGLVDRQPTSTGPGVY